jgi:hypothetical protein
MSHVSKGLTFFFSFLGWGGEAVQLARRPLTDLLYQPRAIDECGAAGGMRIGRGNRSTRKKTCPSSTLSTTHPTWPDLGSNPSRRCGKPATNRLSYGTAYSLTLLYKLSSHRYVRSPPLPSTFLSLQAFQVQWEGCHGRVKLWHQYQTSCCIL